MQNIKGQRIRFGSRLRMLPFANSHTLAAIALVPTHASSALFISAKKIEEYLRTLVNASALAAELVHLTDSDFALPSRIQDIGSGCGPGPDSSTIIDRSTFGLMPQCSPSQIPTHLRLSGCAHARFVCPVYFS